MVNLPVLWETDLRNQMGLHKISAVCDGRIGPQDLQRRDRHFLSYRYRPDGRGRPSFGLLYPAGYLTRQVDSRLLAEPVEFGVLIDFFLAESHADHDRSDVRRFLYHFPEGEHAVPVGVVHDLPAHLDAPPAAVKC